MPQGSQPIGSPEAPEGLRVPRHLGVIMDGNGRWATSQGRPRTDGHVEGVKSLRRLVEYCMRYGTQYLTVFSFSSENWARPAAEIKFIFGLLKKFVDSDLKSLHKNNVRVHIIGERNGLDKQLISLINKVETLTAKNTGFVLQVAFNYGGRAEIVHAAQRLADAVKAGDLIADDITEQTFTDTLYTSGVPDPDVILRTSGEQRLSNFLIWQAAYAELIFVDERWPDFSEEVFVDVLKEYACRERRFGGVEAAAQ